MKKYKSFLLPRRMSFFALIVIAVGAICCVGVKPYEKEYLLGPLMSDQDLQKLNSDFRGSCIASFERLGSSSAGSSNASSCPTCGG